MLEQWMANRIGKLLHSQSQDKNSSRLNTIICIIHCITSSWREWIKMEAKTKNRRVPELSGRAHVLIR